MDDPDHILGFIDDQLALARRVPRPKRDREWTGRDHVAELGHALRERHLALCFPGRSDAERSELLAHELDTRSLDLDSVWAWLAINVPTESKELQILLSNVLRRLPFKAGDDPSKIQTIMMVLSGRLLKLVAESNTARQTAEPADADAQPAKGKIKGMTVAEADATVVPMIDAHFKSMSVHNMALAVGCSAWTFRHTKFWDDLCREQPHRRRGKRAMPRAVSLTDDVMAVTEQDPLQRLIVEEEKVATERVMASGLDDTAKAETLRKVSEGEMTPGAAIEIATMHPRTSGRRKAFKSI